MDATEIASPLTSTVMAPKGWFERFTAMFCAGTAVETETFIDPEETVTWAASYQGSSALEKAAVSSVGSVEPVCGGMMP